jgi:hypothetical protein
MRLPLGDEIIGAVLLCFVIGMSEGVSMFAPRNTPESLRLALEYESLRSLHRARQGDGAGSGSI